MGYIEIRKSLPPMNLVSLVLLLALAGCSDTSDNNPPDDAGLPQADNPVVEGPVTVGGSDDCCKILGGAIDLRSLGYEPGTAFYARALLYPEEDVGYRETEYFLSGSAQSYIATDELTSDGAWSVESAEAKPYKVRIVVDRPIDPQKFNGTVVVEWFNVTAGLDASPDWNHMHTEITREGYVWVGVSAQFVGIEGGAGNAPISIPLKQIDEERYGSLSHPGDSFSYDIFSQAAQAVRNPVGLDPLEGLQVQRMIGVGQSQSAGRLATYINAIHPTIDLFDGFIVHGRGSGSSALSQDPQVAVPTPEVVRIRTDIPEPVLALQAEGDVLWAGVRQPDSAGYRLWEVAGASHSDLYTGGNKGSGDKGDDPLVADVLFTKDVVPPLLVCLGGEVNDGPGHWVTKAALAAVNRWVSTGEAPPSAPYLELNADGTGFELDDQGNVRGGIRTPYVDAPVAVLSGLREGAEDDFLCGLFGSTVLFSEAQLAELYLDKQAYIDAIDASANSARDAGFLVPADAELIKARAIDSPLPFEHP